MVLPVVAETVEFRIATFNVSVEGGNFSDVDAPLPKRTRSALNTDDHRQLCNIAEIIQRVRPDILLLNEFDYSGDLPSLVSLFQRNYLSRGQGDAKPIHYPHVFQAPVNTGIDSGFDLDGNGKTGEPGDAWGFGAYPGQYGMVLLSRFPLALDQVRTFRDFPWRKMPGALKPVNPASGGDWYPPQAWETMPLSSKSHWDVPVRINGKVVHILAAHPTPPVFDGPENRNGRRNHDEIRLWRDYVTPGDGDYLVDDSGGRGALAEGSYFVIVGDLNASPDEGDSLPNAVEQLLASPKINSSFIPVSDGGRANGGDNPYGATHTALWKMRIDYVLPSATGLYIVNGGVFWPAGGDPLAPLVASRQQSSDHRLVWLDLRITGDAVPAESTGFLASDVSAK